MNGIANPLEMSDEDFLNLSRPENLAGSAAHENASPQIVDSVPAVAEEPAVATSPGSAENGGAEDQSGDGPVDDDVGGNDPAPAALASGQSETPAEGGEAAPVAEGEGADGARAEEPTDYEALYSQIMKPFKANGKMVEPRTPEEAISLMQMGANYTRKMQELKPHRATLMMLQEAGLDQQRLSFLIDLDKGDPEAFKKFIADKNIDPLDIDTTSGHAYLGGTRSVTDQDVAFSEALETIRSTQGGAELLTTVHSDWDDASKEMLYQNPEVMPMLLDQRESGVFALISSEIDRQITMGTLPANTPFFQAYLTVGQQLSAAEAAQRKGTGNGDGPVQQVAPAVIGESVATPKSQVAASDKVAAAAPSRGTATKGKVPINPLAMSDDEFLAHMENRV